jgi:uncharacterized membrane protein
MSWKRRFELKEFIQNSLWFIPVIAVILGFVLEYLIVELEHRWAAPETLRFTPDAANTLLTSMFGAQISFTGFVLTMLVLVIQFTGVSFSPRVLIFVFRDRQLKFVLGLFVGTTTYTFLLLTEISDDFSPDWGVLMSGALMLASLLLFLQFLSHLLHGIRPANLANTIGEIGHRVIAEMYPNPVPEHAPAESLVNGLIPDGPPIRVVVKTGSGEIMQSVDVPGLVVQAVKHDALFVLPHAVGDFVQRNGVLIEAFGNRTALSDGQLAGYIAVGPERAVERDPAFALRVLVDIAIKGLSPAINDPTTATHAIDRIEDLLVDLAGRDLERSVVRDHQGTPRVILDSPTWDDFLRLGVSEIRLYGASSVQTARRLGALLESLMEAAPPHRKPPIHRQLRLLERNVREHFRDDDDVRFASIADSQGIGATDNEE